MAAYRVRVALALKGVRADEIAINLDAGEQFAADFLSVNPEGAVPALVEAGKSPMTQSMAILEYIDERFREPPLLPADMHGRARVRSLAALVVSDTHPLLVPRVRAYLKDEAGFDETALRAWSINWMTRGMRAIETRLVNDPLTGKFCHGDRVTMADICLCSLATVAATFKFTLGDVPTLSGIVARCEAIDAFACAHPMRQMGAPP